MRLLTKDIFCTTIPESMENWGTKNIIGSILALGFPLIIGELGSIAQQYADTMMVGYHSTNELAASGFVNSIFYYVVFLTLGMSYASTPVIASAFGRQDYKEVTKAFIESIVLNLSVGIFFVVILSIFYFHLDIFQQPEEILQYAKPYLITLIASVPFLTLFYAFKQYLDALGNTKVSMVIMLVSNVLNIVLNWCLIFGHYGFPDLGLFGAGLSTFISRVVQFVLIVVYVFCSKKIKKIIIWNVRPTIKGIKFQFFLGFPISIQLGLEIAIFNVCGIYAGWLGVDELAAHQAMFTISTICFQVLYGIASAGSIIIGQLNGKNQWQHIRKVSLWTFCVGLVSVSLIMTLLLVCWDGLISCFTNDASVKGMALAILPCFVIYQLGDCLQITYANALRGIESTKSLMWIAFIAYVCVAMPLSYYLTFIHGLNIYGLWAGVPFGLMLAGVMFCYSFFKKTKNDVEETLYKKSN